MLKSKHYKCSNCNFTSFPILKSTAKLHWRYFWADIKFILSFSGCVAWATPRKNTNFFRESKVRIEARAIKLLYQWF